MKKAHRNTVLVSLLATTLLSPVSAVAEPPKEKRFLVRFDHGSANLSPWAGLALYAGDDRVQVYAGDELVHEIPVRAITSITHELRAPFDPAKTTERVLNDTVGACSDLLTCTTLGAAGVVGAAGVGVATLFTPKQMIVTLNWREANESRTLAMTVAWYQRDFILRALERSSGRKAVERKPGSPQRDHATTAPSLPPPAVPSIHAAAPESRANPVTGHIGVFRVILERDVIVCNVVLRRGEYDVYLQDRANGTVVAFTKVTPGAQPARILTRVLSAREPARDDQPIGIVYADPQGGTTIREIRVPGRTLRLPV